MLLLQEISAKVLGTLLLYGMERRRRRRKGRLFRRDSMEGLCKSNRFPGDSERSALEAV